MADVFEEREVKVPLRKQAIDKTRSSERIAVKKKLELKRVNIKKIMASRGCCFQWLAVQLPQMGDG